MFVFITLPSIAILFLIRLSVVTALSSPSSSKPFHEKSRRRFNQDLALGSVFGFASKSDAIESSDGFAIDINPISSDGSPTSSPSSSVESNMDKQRLQIAYKTLSLSIPNFGCSIPVAMWFPIENNDKDVDTSRSQVRYQYRISVKRIGQLLAGWDFIPEFVSRKFSIEPSVAVSSPPFMKQTVWNGESTTLPKSPNVVILAHGYLGSRFDLSHVAEELASEGFVCISPEYPESLAASYARQEGLDRSAINQHLLSYVRTNLQPASYAGIGHSLGCGTVLRMGDDSWTRVLIAGRPPEVSSSPLLFISSTNDCTVRFGGLPQIPSGYSRLSEPEFPSQIPFTSALIFDRPDGPNHISYLSENVNEAMISFLSPLLPVAQTLSIPVLDFDKYQQSRDSRATAAIVQPLISKFLAQHTNLKATSS